MDESNELNKETTSSKTNKMIEGTFWLTVGNFLSRFLGLIYIIPWYSWMGNMQKYLMDFMEWVIIYMLYFY